MADDPIDPADAVEDAALADISDDDAVEAADVLEADDLDEAEAAEDVEAAEDGEVDAVDTDVAADVIEAEVDLDEADVAADEAEVVAPVKKPGAAAVDKAAAPVVRRRVTSKRVTPKGTAQGEKITSSGRSQAARAEATTKSIDDDEPFRAPVPPRGTYAPGPSPWWVPAIMFGLLIVGALVIMLNYMGAFGDPSNVRLIIGLGFILAGIIAATQYR